LPRQFEKSTKTCKNRAFLQFFRFTSFALFRMMITTREQGFASEPNKYRVSRHVEVRTILLAGGLMATQRMTQTQLVRGLAEAGEVTNKQSRAILDHLSSLAVSEVKKNGVFVLPGIGRLVRVDRKARLGRNPATGEAIKIPAKKVVKFRVAKAAKDAIVPPKVKKA
jgi:DNA-binding protein HU-beta